MAGGVLVDQRVVEDGVERPDPPLLVDEGDFAEPCGPVVLRDRRPKRVDADVGVGLHGPPALELDADALHVGAEELERHRRGHVAVDPRGVGCREDLLGRQVRVVDEPVHGLEVGAEPPRARQQADRQVRARPLQVDRVEAPLGHPLRARDDRLHPLEPRRRRIVGVEAEDVHDLVPEGVEGLLGLEVGMHPLRPAEIRVRACRPVRRLRVDDLRRLCDVRQDVAAHAGGIDPFEVRALARQRDAGGALVGQPLEAAADPGRHVVERRLVRVQEPLAFDERIPPEDVDVLRAPLVGGPGEGAGRVLHAEVGGDAEDLPGLEVGAEADQEVGEPIAIAGAVLHRGGRLQP